MGLGRSLFRPTNQAEVQRAQQLAMAQEEGKRASTRGGSPFEILTGAISGMFTGGPVGAVAGGLGQALGQKSALAPESGLSAAFQGGLSGVGAQGIGQGPLDLQKVGTLAAGIQDPQSQLIPAITKLGQLGGAQAAGAKKAGAAETKTTQGLRKEFDSQRVIKDADTIFAAVTRMNSAFDDFSTSPGKKASKNALDQALVITFNKMLDPGSVVRESEFARTPQGQAVVSRLQGFAEKIEEGGVGLTDPERAEIVRMANVLGEGHLQSVQEVEDFFAGEAESAGVDPGRVVRKRDFIRPTTLEAATTQPNVETAVIEGVTYEIVRDAQGKAIGRRRI